MANCTLCNYKFTEILRQPINCNKCNEQYCLKCLKNDLSNNNFKCSFCDELFKDDWLETILGTSYYNTLLKKLGKLHSCNICAEPFTNVVRKRICCEYCDKVCCLKCFKTYIINKENMLKCMFCKEIFESEFLEETFSYSFVLNLEAGILFEKEKKNLIFTQMELDLEKKQNELLEIIDKHKNELDSISTYDDNGVEYSIKESLISKLELDIKNLTVNYVKKCNNTYPINCMGLLSENNLIGDYYLCSLCNSKSCKNCEDILSNDNIHNHICNTNVLESLKTIKEETKPCPSCFTKIYKSEGCLQMYCIQCFTTFDWNTGKIDTGKIHNPHYIHSFRYYKRDPLDIQCGRELTANVWNDETHKYYTLVKLPDIRSYFCAACNSANYIAKQIKDYTNENSINKQLRINYLTGIIDEQTFKYKCLNNIKIAKTQTQLLDIIVTFKNCSTEIFYRLFDMYDNNNNNLTDVKIDSFKKEFKVLLDLCNHEYNKISYKEKNIIKLSYGIDHF